ncbi:GNAT family N-acetyltransferase [Algibacillus agarilyticus]|uniref:GNAT family N-acetyltransferase n=1 Tax=Algibacillus agarilyticus TaxID=2234133 RepID=UPI000DCFC453|nr:GNAT family N-acetyltransferase [Algibacillus agarilyticus]
MQFLPIDLTQTTHCDALLYLMSQYALDPKGGGVDLKSDVKQNLIPQLKKQPNYLGFIIWDDAKPIAMANCFTAFSTFAAKPLINIHDFAVLPAYRGQGIGKRLMSEITAYASTHDFCKITLEVLSNNTVAKAVYDKAGFKPYELAGDVALFWQKPC